MLIAVDAGHGGKDPGAVNYSGVKEKDLALELAKMIASEIKALGAEAILTRSSDVFVELQNRTKLANEVRANLFISIHFNAGSIGASGHEVLFFENSASGKNLAAKINSSLASLKLFRNRGIKPRGDLYVLKATKMPACLIEVCFITNPDDLKAYQANKDKIAKAIARAVLEYAGFKRKLFRVIAKTGTYKTRAEAEKASKVISKAVSSVSSVFSVNIVEE